MEKFNEKMLFEYTPSNKVYSKALDVSITLGKTSMMIRETFKEPKIASRIFAFIESKYSSKIEGIYTTLFDVANTGKDLDQEHLIRPLVTELFQSQDVISLIKLNKLASIINTNKDESKRWGDKFGIYQNKDTLIYQPPADKKEVDRLLGKILKKAEKDKTIIDILHTHVIFEKIHPFVDGNGRLGRLIMQKYLARLTNFSNALPLSWAFFKNINKYYEAFDTNNGLSSCILNLLNIFEFMLQKLNSFLIDVQTYYKKAVKIALNTTNKVNINLARDIILSLQTKRKYIERKYMLNVRTIDKIFDNLNLEMPFNRKHFKKDVLYWNISLEEIIDKHFN